MGEGVSGRLSPSIDLVHQSFLFSLRIVSEYNGFLLVGHQINLEHALPKFSSKVTLPWCVFS